MDPKLKEELQNYVIKVLESDQRPMTLNFLMHCVFEELQKNNSTSVYISQKEFLEALKELTDKCWVGKTKYNKYYLDYLDYEEIGEEQQGFLEVDVLTGHGYITIKRNYREYKKPSYFVHKKNINSAQWGDYVSFVELNNTKPKKFVLKDAKIKKVLPKPKLEM